MNNKTNNTMKTTIYSLLVLFIAVSCKKDDPSNPILPEVDDVCTVMEDLKFMKYCYDNFDVNKDSKVSTAEAKAAKSIRLSGISSLKGIEYFQGLTLLECPAGSITSLNLSYCTQLTSLVCSGNKLENLQISECTKLTDINCASNKLFSLDLSYLPDLEKVQCQNNSLLDLNPMVSTNLKSLNCSNNKLASLTVTQCTKLETLNCSNNRLPHVDVSRCIALKSLYCYLNQFTTLYLSSNTELVTLMCGCNAFSKIDVSSNKQLSQANLVGYSSIIVNSDQKWRFYISDIQPEYKTKGIEAACAKEITSSSNMYIWGKDVTISVAQ